LAIKIHFSGKIWHRVTVNLALGAGYKSLDKGPADSCSSRLWRWQRFDVQLVNL